MLAAAPSAWGQAAPIIIGVDFTSDAGADHFYAEGDEVETTVTFDAVVHVFEGEVRGVVVGELVLRLAIGERERDSQYCGGSGTVALRFCYAVARGDEDADGISIGSFAAALQGGRIESATGTPASRAFDAHPPDDTHRVDARRPTITGADWASTPRSPPSYELNEGIDVELRFSENVHVTQNDDTLRLLIDVGGRARAAAYLSGHGTDRLLFRYRVRADDQDDDGIHIEAGADDGGTLLGGAVTDAAGNNASRAFNGLPRDSNRRVSGVTGADPPTVEQVAMASAPGEYIIGEHLEATVAFDEDVFVTGTPTLTLGVGARQRPANYLADGSTPMLLRFRYTVVDGDLDEDGIAIGANALALNGGAIRDRAGTAADLSFPAIGTQAGHRVSGVRPRVVQVDFVGASASYIPPQTVEAQVRFDRDVTPATGSQAPALLLQFGPQPQQQWRMTLRGSTARTLRFGYRVRAGDNGTNISIEELTGTVHGADGNEADLTFSAVSSTRRVSGGADSTAPTVENLRITSTPPRPDVENSNGGPHYGIGDRLTMEAVFSEPVYVTGTPAPAVDFSLARGTAQAAYASGSGSDTLTFEYVIQDVDSARRGIDIPADPIRGGTIADAAGNTASLSHPATNATGTHRIEAIRPLIRDFSITSTPTASGGPYRAGESIRVEVAFDESVCLAPSSELALTLVVGTSERRMEVRGSAPLCGGPPPRFTQSFYFFYTVKAGERDPGGVSVEAGAFTGEIRDYFGNEWIGRSPAIPANTGHAVDGGADTDPPRVLDVRIPRATLKRGDHLDIAVRTSEPVFAAGEPTIPLMMNGGERLAALRAGDGTNTLTFRYTVGGVDAQSVAIPADSLRDGVITDAAGNALNRSFTRRTAALRVDGVRPRVLDLRLASDAGSDRTYKQGETITAAVTMSERVCVAGAAPTLTLGIGGGERQARLAEIPRCGSGSQTLRFAYTVQAGDSAPTGVAIPAGALRGGNLRDIAGNEADRRNQALPASERHRVSGAADAGRVEITSEPRGGAYVAGETIQLEVTFGEALPANVRASLALNIGARTRAAELRDVQPRALVFAYTVVAGDQDDDGISIQADALTATPPNYDWALAPIVNDVRHRVDAIAPAVEGVTVTSAAEPPYGEGDTIRVHVEFTERVWASENPRLRIDMDRRKHGASFTEGSGTMVLTFAYTVQPGDNDDDGIAIDANALVGGELLDAAGNEVARQLPPVEAPNEHTVETGTDGRAPSIVEMRITSKPRFQNTYAIDEVVEVQVIFSEAVNVLEVCPVDGQVLACELPVLQLDIGGTSRSARIEPQDDASDTLTFRHTIAEGELDTDGISIPANALTGGSIVDYSGTANTVNRTYAGLNDNPDHKVDGERPVVRRIPSIDSEPNNPSGYGPGETIRVTLTFNEPITISGTPTLRLTIGSRDRSAQFDGLANGDQSARFSYVVQVGDSDPDGIAIGMDALMGGEVRDLVGNTFERRMPARLSDPDHKVDGDSDSIGPVIERLTLSEPANRTSYALFEPIDVRVRFNEPAHVVAGEEPTIALSIGPETRRAAFSAGDGTNTLVFRYVVQPGDRDEDGISVGPNVLRGANIVDGAGNPAVLNSVGLPANGNRKVETGYDSDSPRVLSTMEGLELLDPPRPAGWRGGDIIEVRVRFNERVRVTGTPTVALSIGPDSRLAEYRDGAGTETLVFQYRVQPGDIDTDGIIIANDALSGDITDASDNRAFPWLPSEYAEPNRKYRVDAVAPNIESGPVVTSSPASGDTYTTGEHLELRITFDDAVRVSGDLTLRLQVGGAVRSADLVPLSNEGARALNFRYTVVAGDVDANGVATPVNALVGGTVADSIGNPADLALARLPDQPKHKVDGVKPTATIVITSTPASGDTYGPDEYIEVQLTFGEAVSVPDETTVKLALNIGRETRQAALHRFDQEANRIVFRYTVQHGDFDADGVSVEGEALRGDVRDSTGNAAGRTFNLADQAGHKVDTSATLVLAQLELEVGGPEVDIPLSDYVFASVLYSQPSTTDPNVAAARISGHRLTIIPGFEGTAVVSVTAVSEAEIILNFPVRVSAATAEMVVVSDALAAMGRGMLASIANTIGTRLELGAAPQAPGLVVGGRRWDGGGAHHAERLAAAKWVAPLGHGPMGARLGEGWDGTGPGFSASGLPAPGFGAGLDRAAPPSPNGGIASGQLWRGTSFHLPLEMSLIAGPSDTSWAVWGGGDYTRLGGESENGSYDGQMTSAYLGMDVRGDGWVAGGAVGHTTARTDYEYQTGRTGQTGEANPTEPSPTPPPRRKGELETTLTTFHPYVATSWAGQAKAWIIMGFGTGEATMEREDPQYSPEPADLSMRMALIGASGTVDPPGGFDISLRADAGVIALETGSGAKAIDELAVSAQRARVGVEFSYMADNRPVVGGVRLPSVAGYHGTFTPFLEIAARHDAGDGPTGTGGEVTAGLRYQSDTVNFEAKAHTLAVHSADGYEETGASATLAVAPRGSGGWRFSVSPSWGDSAHATDVFFNADYAARLAQGRAGGSATAAYDEWRMNARLERAMPLRGRLGQAAPFAETSFSGDTRRARAGFSLQTRTGHAGDLRFDVAGERADGPRGAENRMLVRMQGRF